MVTVADNPKGDSKPIVIPGARIFRGDVELPELFLCEDVTPERNRFSESPFAEKLEELICCFSRACRVEKSSVNLDVSSNQSTSVELINCRSFSKFIVSEFFKRVNSSVE